jgi:hypothetical protein
VKASLPDFTLRVAALVHHFAPAAGVLANQHYMQVRDSEGVSGPFHPHVAASPPMAQIGSAVRWATSDLLVTGGSTEVHMAPSPETVQIVHDRLDGAVGRLITNTARETTIANVKRDRAAVAWARVTRPDACYFCRMLATRGAVYENQFTAGRAANKRFVGEGEFKFHNDCHCTIEPLFSKHYEPPAHTRADQALWNEVTAGLSGQDAINAFRRAVEGRSDGPSRGGSKRPRPFGFDSLTPDQLRHQLSIVEGLKPSDYRDAQVKRIRKRLADLGA